MGVAFALFQSSGSSPGASETLYCRSFIEGMPGLLHNLSVLLGGFYVIQVLSHFEVFQDGLNI